MWEMNLRSIDTIGSTVLISPATPKYPAADGYSGIGYRKVSQMLIHWEKRQ